MIIEKFATAISKSLTIDTKIVVSSIFFYSMCDLLGFLMIYYLGVSRLLQFFLFMELPIGNFFEVTINTNKLFSFMEDIMRKVDIQDARIGQLSRLIGSTGNHTDEKLKTLEDALMIEVEKVKKLEQQDANYLKLFIRDVDKKAIDKQNELEAAIAQLSTKINTTRTALEEDFAIKLSYLEKKISNQTAIEELDQKFSTQLSKITTKINNIEETRQSQHDIIEQHIKKNAEMNQNILERLNHPKQDENGQNNGESVSSSFRDPDSRSQSKRKHRTNKNDNLFSQLQEFCNNVQQKIDTLETKMIENSGDLGDGTNLRRSIISNNKVVKYYDKINKVPSKSAFGKKNQNRIKTLERNLIDKLTKIEELSINRLAFIEKQMFKQTNKSQIIDEHISILSRKLQKEKIRINEVTDTVRVANDKKVDEKTIQNIRNTISKMSKDFQLAIQTRLQKDFYEQQRSYLIERIQRLRDYITEKADKTEVKKGLSFLQQKLKDVIIVIAEQKSAASHQDGAIKKTPFKCLSCDKDLQIEKMEAVQSVGHNRHHKQNSTGNLRSVTSQMRKRIRLINTVPTVNYDD